MKQAVNDLVDKQMQETVYVVFIQFLVMVTEIKCMNILWNIWSKAEKMCIETYKTPRVMRSTDVALQVICICICICNWYLGHLSPDSSLCDEPDALGPENCTGFNRNTWNAPNVCAYQENSIAVMSKTLKLLYLLLAVRALDKTHLPFFT